MKTTPKKWFLLSAVLLLITLPHVARSQQDGIHVVSDSSGTSLQVNGKSFMVLGMNWDYFPIGKNYAFGLWSQSDEYIRAALDAEMPLLKGMGVNTIRVYSGIPPQWVEYIYTKYGIYTALNHTLGRYGVTADGVYYPVTNYSDPKIRNLLIREVESLVEEYRNVPGMLMWLLGNENNYGLEWSSAETEALPVGEREAAKARSLYSLVGEVIGKIKQHDSIHPVAFVNGDLQYIDIIATEVKGMDIFGSNCYRGISFRDAFQTVHEKLHLPILFMEFGADAFNAKEMREDQATQAKYLLGQWKEIFEQSKGKGRAGNAIGGFTFQFSDGWWKYKQESNLSVHDNNASWPNGGYPEDFVPGENNMNEEWWGICAKGPTDFRGLYQLYPRAAYYALKQAFNLDPYGPGTDIPMINRHFAAIDPNTSVLTARGDAATLAAIPTQQVRMSGLRLELNSINTGGEFTTTPETAPSGSLASPSFRGFDHLESFYAGVEAHPAANVSGSLVLNVLGHVPENAIDQIFYENRGRKKTVLADSGTIDMYDIDRLKVYRASMSWDDRWFKLDGFFRTGHYHWGYEGDFFGLYQEANYGPNIDVYNSDVPIGFEMAGKKSFDGLKVAFGPELWWGANPAILVKYQRMLGPVQATVVLQDDIAKQGNAVTSLAIPLPPTRKATLHLAMQRGPLGIEVGGICSGNTKIDQSFQIVDGTSGNYRIFQDRIKASDTYGGKIKLTVSSGRWNWYGQGAIRGLVADGGPTSALTYTGWHLKDNGSGNEINALTGLAVTFGNWQLAPNILWQKPIEGPIPADVPAPGRPRNILGDPFAVRANRETRAAEFLVTFDPTPATWMYSWDNDEREDATFAANFGVIYRNYPTTQDVGIGLLADGRTTFAFPSATPSRDLWEVHSRIVSKLGPGLGMIANLFAGTGEPNGNDARVVHRFGGDFRLNAGSARLAGFVKVNDWGPYDYHRDFNLTYPLQLTSDLSYALGIPDWIENPRTRVGVRFTWRTLDQYSPRFAPGIPVIADAPYGNEWEIRTYLNLNVGL